MTTITIPTVSSRDLATTYSVDPTLKALWITEAVLHSGTGGAIYRRANSEPAVDAALKFRTQDRYLPDGITVDNINGGWWKIDLSTTNPLMAGASYNSISDDSTSFNAIGNSTPFSISVGDTHSGSLLLNSVSLPYNCCIQGSGDTSLLNTGDGSGLDDLSNTNPTDNRKRIFSSNITGNNWTVPTPGVASGSFNRLRLNASAARSSTPNRSVTGIEFGGSQIFRDIRATGLESIVKQCPTTYSDLVTVERVVCYQQFTPTYRDSSSGYIVELPYSGDGVHVRHVIGSYGASDESGNITRGKSVYLRYKVGALVEDILNGDVVLADCHAVTVRGLHMEQGQLHIVNSSVTVRDSVFYSRKDPPYNVRGIVIETVSGNNSVDSSIISLNNITFLYFNKISGSTTWDYANNKPDFQITGNDAPMSACITLDNIVRMDQSDTNQSQRQYYGSSCGFSDFDHMTHFASKHSQYFNGSWLITGCSGALNTGPGITASIDSFSHRRFDGTPGTYYYRALALYDPIRMVGSAGTMETSATATAGLNGAIQLIVDGGWRSVPCILRIFRGTASGVYDSWLDIALIAGTRLFDNGNDICGYPWLTRTSAGAADVMNSATDYGFEVRPGMTTGASDAYGNARVLLSADTLPVTGGWKIGDILELAFPPSISPQGRRTGYRRLTNCTSTTSSNHLGTDWLPLYMPA